METRHLEMRANSFPPQETFKAPWKMIIYSKVVFAESRLGADADEKKCGSNNPKRHSSQGHKHATKCDPAGAVIDGRRNVIALITVQNIIRVNTHKSFVLNWNLTSDRKVLHLMFWKRLLSTAHLRPFTLTLFLFVYHFQKDLKKGVLCFTIF